MCWSLAMPMATTSALLSTMTQCPNPRTGNAKRRSTRGAPAPRRKEGIAALDLGIKELAVRYTDQRRFYHIGGFKGYRYYNKQLDKLRSKRDKCKKKSRRYIKLTKRYQQVAAKKRRKQQDCHHKASHLIAYRLAESAVVVGDLSQRHMVIKKQEHETRKTTAQATDQKPHGLQRLGNLQLCADAGVQM